MPEQTESIKSWLVAIACCAASGIVMCPYRLSGLLFVELLEEFHTDREKASMPVFMFFLMFGLMGPLSGWFGHKIGEEMTTLIGCFIAALGFGLTYFATNVTFAIISLGLIYGLGLSMSMILIPSVLKKHFTKNFNTAYGITLAGPCLGALIFPPIAVFMLKIYDVSGTFLIIGGLMLNGVPLAMLLKVACPKKIHQQQKLPQENVEDFMNTRPCSAMVEIKNHQDKNPYEFEINEKNSSKNVQSTLIEDNNQHLKTFEQQNKYFSNSMYMYLKLFRNSCFIFYMINVCISVYVPTVIWTTMIDYSRDKKIDTKYEVHLLMFPSLFDMIGRFALVWVVDKKYMSSTSFAIVINVLLAISCVMMIFSTSISVLMSAALLFGLGTGGFLTVLPGQVFEFMEKDFYIMAMSSRLLLYVPLSFTAAPLVDYFRTELKSYDGLYYLIIALCLLSCCISPLTRRFSKVNKRKLNNTCVPSG